MNNYIVIDTTALISYFHDIFEVECVISDVGIDMMERAFISSEYKVIIPSIVFIEIYIKWFVSDELVSKIRIEIFKRLEELENVFFAPIEKEILEYVFEITYKPSKIKFDNHDKLVLATAMMYKAPLITSDKKIIKFQKANSILPQLIS